MKALRLLGTASAALALTFTGAVLAPATAAPTTEQSDAAAWLASMVPDDTHLFASRYGAGETDVYVDHGLNLDLQFALREYGDAALADQVYDAVIADLSTYTDAFGTRYAGAVGKSAAYIELNGDDASNIAGRDLIADLKGLMATSEAEAGRFKDSPDSDYQSANTVGQAWGVRALALAGDGAVGAAADYLASQQCADGGFSTAPVTAGGDCRSEGDTTSFAVIALAQAGGHDDAITDAVNYLLASQAADGSFQGADEASANSAGLAGEVLRRYGHDAEADKASAWLASIQLDSGPDSGAISPGKADFTEFNGKEIAPLAEDRFVRASVQAILGLDAADEPVEPGPLTELIVSASDVTPNVGDTITLTATGRDANGTDLGDVTADVTWVSSVASDSIDGNRATFNSASPHTFTATHVPTGVTATVTVEVSADVAGGGSGSGTVGAGGTGSGAATSGVLPNAGSTTPPWHLGAAVAALSLGAALIVASRERRMVGAHRGGRFS